MTIDQLLGLALSLAKDGSIILFMMIVMYTGYREIWVWGYHYKRVQHELEEERKQNRAWQEVAMRGTNLARTALSEITSKSN